MLVACALLTWFTVGGAVASPGEAVTGSSNWGVLFLLAMPYAVGGSIAGWIVFSHRRAAKKLSGRQKGIHFMQLVETPKEDGR